MLPRFPARSTALRSVFLLAMLPGLGVVVHCAHPSEDYEKYLEIAKTRASEPPPATCLGTPVTSDVDISGTFAAYCRVNFATASQALVMATTFTKSADKVEAKLTPLKIGAKTINDTVGDPQVSATGTIVAGEFSLDVGTVKVSGAANPISGSDIELSGAVFKAVINSKDEILAELEGQLIKPFTFDLSDPANSDICLFTRLSDGMTLPDPPPGETELSCRVQPDGGTDGGTDGGDGGPCMDDGTLYCGKTRCELPSISSCDDAMPSECAKAMCATSMPTDCKQVLLDCYADIKCNNAVSCGAVCLAQDPNANTINICGPLAGTSISKALAYKTCAGKLTACGGDGTFDPPGDGGTDGGGGGNP